MRTAAAAACHHAGKEAEREIDNGMHVEIDHAAKRVEVLILEEARGHHRGIVDEHVGMEAEAPQRLLDAGTAFLRAQILRRHPHLDAMRIGKVTCDARQGRLVAGHEQKGVTPPGEFFRERPPETFRGAGNDDGGSRWLALVVGVVHCHAGHSGGQVSGGKGLGRLGARELE